MQRASRTLLLCLSLKNSDTLEIAAALSVGHRICRLHPLQRGKTPPNAATCCNWPWVDTRKVRGRDPGG